MSKIYFKVAPYALFDVLKAFENDSDIHRRIDYTVTKEDGELVVIANENYKQVVHKESLNDLEKHKVQKYIDKEMKSAIKLIRRMRKLSKFMNEEQLKRLHGELL